MNRRGVSIAELLAGIAVGAIVLIFALQGVISYFATAVAMRNQVGQVQDVSLVKLKLGLGVGGGNLRTYFWTGNGPASPEGICGGCTATGTDALLGRMIVPFPNKCRDLKTECTGSVSILTAKPLAVGRQAYALCMIDSERVLATGDTKMGHLIGIVNSPRLSLFYINGAAESITDLSNLSSDCLQAIKRQFGGTPTAGSLFSLPIRPAIAGNLTGGTCVCAEDRMNAAVEYPARMMDVDVYALGLLPDPTAPPGDRKIYSWGINHCLSTNASTGMSFDCAGDAELKVSDVLYVEVDQKYQVHDQSAPDIWYSLNPSPDPQFCIPKTCRSMNVPTRLNVRLPGEAPTQLIFSTFSLLKQDVLKKMRFQVLQKNGKVQTAEIQF